MFLLSLPMRGAWIEIPQGIVQGSAPRCRSPCGGRGLKYFFFRFDGFRFFVAPHAGAWIEIRRFSQPQVATRVAPMRGAWIEILPHR